jgi:hypothetical protein
MQLTPNKKRSFITGGVDPLKLLKSSCEVLEELGIELSNSAAKISRISRLSNNIKLSSGGELKQRRLTEMSPSPELVSGKGKVEGSRLRRSLNQKVRKRSRKGRKKGRRDRSGDGLNS